MTKSTDTHLVSGLIRKRGEIAGQHKAAVKAADAIKSDLDALDRALAICGYKGDPHGIEPRGKYKTMFVRNELKLMIMGRLKEIPADDRAIADQIIQTKGWEADGELRLEIIKRVRHALQRLKNTDRVVSDFGPNGALWKRAT
ncbi:hypothetical protein ACFQ14_08865 [Pseudahrensia aquimaris]|uniref:DUF2285 domain-containing protein n=1 Tax=Pseudahrensia aquimaris TaxID=744461 RepID=A0ABW3FDI4_9HYPH